MVEFINLKLIWIQLQILLIQILLIHNGSFFAVSSLPA